MSPAALMPLPLPVMPTLALSMLTVPSLSIPSPLAFAVSLMFFPLRVISSFAWSASLTEVILITPFSMMMSSSEFIPCLYLPFTFSVPLPLISSVSSLCIAAFASA